MKNRIITGILVLAAIGLVSGATFLAMATQEDPAITMSYLNNTFRQQMLEEVTKAGQELTRGFDARIAVLEADLKAGQGGSSQASNSAERFSVVTLSRGQSLTCAVGAELMLRIGTATGSGSAPALVDYTSGDTLSSGTALAANHMYLVTIEGNGIKATADTVRVLVRGTYKVS